MVFPVDEVHVLQHPRSGRWLVDTADGEAPAAGYRTAGEAQRAAQRHAADRGLSRVCLHDCYHRVHSTSARGRQGAAKG